MNRIEALQEKTRIRVAELVAGKTFDEMVSIYEELDEKILAEGLDEYVLIVLASHMEKADSNRFVKWCEEY